jgi:hypothetical protein
MDLLFWRSGVGGVIYFLITHNAQPDSNSVNKAANERE